MRRRTFDALMATAGLVAAIILAIAGGLLVYAHSFVHGQVTDQLTAQQIYFPDAGSDALAPANIGPYLNQYAGEQLTTGAQAEAYANHFIAVHLQEIGGGQTYAQLSAKAMADPKNADLAGQVATMFKGETLRGLLLNAYAFDTMAAVALWAGIAALVGAAVMFVLSVLGFVHLRNTPTDAELTLGARTPAPVEP
jgi:hypothetical protein